MSATCHPSLIPYLDWARERLPMHLPAEVVEQALDLPFRVEGLSVWTVMNDRRGEEMCAYTAPDEQELRLWLFERICWQVAVGMDGLPEVSEREEARWRFVEDPSRGLCPNGRYYVRENPTYEFDALYDVHKWQLEFILQLMRNTMPASKLRLFAARGESILNVYYPNRHWAFDATTATYREISHSLDRYLLPRLPEDHPLRHPDPEKTLHSTVKPYARWILEHLPPDVTDEEAKRALMCLRDGQIKGTSYWKSDEDAPSFRAGDEDELRRRLFSEVCHWIAVTREPEHREQERARYRYDWPTVRQDSQVVHLPPTERADYEYRGTFDHRKWWMEEHLRLIRRVATKAEQAATVSYYRGQLNRRYPDKHWAFHPWKRVFVEVSMSKQTGIEDALAGRKPEPWHFPEEKPFFVLRSFLRFVRGWFLGF